MATLPESQHTTSAAIVRWYESKPQDHRPHMGASLIGHQCDRYIWLTWRWVLKPEFSGRMLRLFSTGQREEARLIEELRGIGAQVWDKDPETDQQFRVSSCNGHFGGSLDGIGKGLPEAPKSPCVLEFKTHNERSFNELMAKKVQAAKPQHYDQMTVYMGLMELDRAMYMGVNKNTDEVYCEWVHFDKDHFMGLMHRAQRLIEETASPQALSADPAYYVCKMCTFWKHCHGGMAAEANCRTCCHASPVENAAWHCQQHDKQLTDKAQREGCKDHLMIPSLVPYGEPVDGGQTWIAYKHRTTGAYFTNSTGPCTDYGPNFLSKELHNCPGELIADMAGFKNVFPGSKVVPGSGSVKPNTDLMTAFDDIATHPDDILTKPDAPAKKVERKKNAAMLEVLKNMEAKK